METLFDYILLAIIIITILSTFIFTFTFKSSVDRGVKVIVRLTLVAMFIIVIIGLFISPVVG